MSHSAQRKILAIIPARKGSKGLPGKNIINFEGKPLIAWAIESALESGVVDKIICSTDGNDIRDIALQHGAEVPFLRPDNLATCEANVLGAVQYTLAELDKSGYRPDITVLLQPTSPLRTGTHVREALNLLHDEECDSVISLCESSDPPYWMRTIENDRVKPFIDHEGQYYQRQKLPKTYTVNGAIYASFTSVITQGALIGENTRPYLMTQEDSIDIDTELDLRLARCIAQAKKGK
ncbi:cytidylyltransferase domain-containing protein [Desulfovibrio ferrophilus]|uniref:N-acylneuraminate cytidylyltransferase n=1 Tax=Desulfovibrio ferrophilus TaxID=241368 RepID=A0A2Z6B1Q2_9BACT|nr:acylneuraminate cytidylyltransferase family protein [Desulfovibrio ferrophilus]BBD09326.1 N-acylneuraminate cytidylyltransferase [Desulfovibrio ferrophilus]